MFKKLGLFKESLMFAIDSLLANKLRTFLSLTGVTIGIFCMIGVFTLTDSLKNNVKAEIDKLGQKELYVGKFSWEMNSDYPWWKYMNRPQPSLKELDAIMERTKFINFGAFFTIKNKTLKYLNSSADNARITGISFYFNKIAKFDLEYGRYFTLNEAETGTPVVILGATIKENLFGNGNPLGKTITLDGLKVKVIGVMKKQGESMIKSDDTKAYVPVNFFKTFTNINNNWRENFLVFSPNPKISDKEVRYELTGILRSIRRLSPSEPDDFAINESSFITKSFEPFLFTLTIAGILIGGFSILVGGFGIANIMFVSVKERTGQIGIQKALGAKNSFILTQFLFESVLLCLIGGLLGLLGVFIVAKLITNIADFNMTLNYSNVFNGIALSVIIGVISGVIPAFKASKLNPVEAIRS